MQIKMRIFSQIIIFNLILFVLPFSSSAQNTYQINDQFRFVGYSIPKDSHLPSTFSVCKPGLIFLPLEGGIYVPGWDSWLLPPGKENIKSLACNDDQELFILNSENELICIKGGVKSGNREKLSDLPKGDYNLLSNSKDLLWIWGKKENGSWEILLYKKGKGFARLWKGTKEIRAGGIAGKNLLVTAIGKDVVLWGPKMGPRHLVKAKEPIQGIAANHRGSIMISTTEGIIELVDSERPRLIAEGIHGPLFSKGKSVYVLWKEKFAIFQIKPRENSATAKTD